MDVTDLSPSDHRWLLDRLADKFLIGDGCWEWTGARYRDGYGQFRLRDYSRKAAHRVLYEFMVGPIPEGMQLDHLCHDPNECQLVADCPHRRCVRPDHLDPVTRLENVRRSGVSAAQKARHASRTHCRKCGGALVGENVRILTNRVGWWRQCVSCAKASQRRRNATRGPRRKR